MKTTVEIPEALFRQAKARAALDGLSLRDFLMRGLQLALQTPPATPSKHRTNFPLICVSKNALRLTDEQVSAALDTDEELA